MKKILLSVYFIFFISHQIAERLFNFQHAFINSYLDDFLFLPLFLFTVEFIFAKITRNSIPLQTKHYIVLIVFILLVVEVVFPLLSNRFVFDYFDFIAYLLGYFCYIAVLKIFANDNLKTT